VAADAVPVTVSGAARFNVANALAACAAAMAMKLDDGALLAGLLTFRGDPLDNPGRANRFQLGGATVIIDFAHNPHGLAALVDLAARLPARRRLVLIGQAGDRSDAEIRELTRTAWRLAPDRVIAKDMPSLLRGRKPGVVPTLILAELAALGAAPGSVSQAPDEPTAIRQALAWARDGDLVVLLVHANPGAALTYLADLSARGWKPGDALP
jgi:UDP-N-acetylmuramyl tripeptide synthase